MTKHLIDLILIPIFLIANYTKYPLKKGKKI